MAAMTTVLTEFSNSGSSRTSTLTGHTAIEPKLVIEKRKVPEGNQTMVEYSCKVVHATEDADGVILTNKVSFEACVRYPVLGQSADVTAALAFFVDIIGGDEFANSVSTQEWLT
jgi:hypothetical protein